MSLSVNPFQSAQGNPYLNGFQPVDPVKREVRQPLFEQSVEKVGFGQVTATPAVTSEAATLVSQKYNKTVNEVGVNKPNPSFTASRNKGQYSLYEQPKVQGSQFSMYS